MFTFEQSVHITQEFYQLPEQLFDNPWFIGIITGFVSSVLASAVTGKYIWSKAENKMKKQKLIFIADKLDSIAANFDNTNNYKNYIKTFIDASATKLNSDFRSQMQDLFLQLKEILSTEKYAPLKIRLTEIEKYRQTIENWFNSNDNIKKESLRKDAEIAMSEIARNLRGAASYIHQEAKP